MKNFLTILILAAVLLCTAFLLTKTAKPLEVPAFTETEPPAPLPNSILYHGTVEKIVKDDAGSITQLRMTSEGDGDYEMNISDRTVWIDSGKQAAADPSALQAGDRISIFHSPVATMSLPPQSAAFAVVTNIPMDAVCAQYHEVEAVSLEGKQWKITTENGSLSILADHKTTLSRYGSDAEISWKDILPDNHVMAWYGTAEAGQAYAQHLMLLP